MYRRKKSEIFSILVEKEWRKMEIFIDVCAQLLIHGGNDGTHKWLPFDPFIDQLDVKEIQGFANELLNVGRGSAAVFTPLALMCI